MKYTFSICFLFLAIAGFSQKTTDKDTIVAKSLQEVIVTSKKPPIEVKADKTILNVQGSINASGTDALELLRKAPGVLVDRDDNISMGGKNGVKVYIDGRPSPLAGKDLADYLKTLQSDQIESIELITNPSARFDAAGNAGIINIRLKKNKAYGTNGAITAGYNIGIFSKYTSGLSLNHRKGKANVFGNYNYSYNKNEMFMNIDREQLDTSLAQSISILSKGYVHNFRAGIDYTLSRYSTAGIILNGTISANKAGNDSRTVISHLPTGIPDRILIADNSNKPERNNTGLNLNYRFADTSGRELNIDADYGNYQLRNNQLQPNYYYHPENGNELYHVVNQMITPTDINMYVVKMDYEQSFIKGRLGIGGKISFVNTQNSFKRYDIDGNTRSLDLTRSNFFEYRESIYATYINYNRQFPGMTIQAGLRMENTASEGNSYPLHANGSIDKSTRERFTRIYTDLFPNGAVTFNKNPMNQFSITYSRRIDRPAYQDLNPFEFKLDEYTFQKGNTLLRPQYSNSVGITHSYRYKLNTSLTYSKVKDVLAQLVDTTERSKSFITKKNMATQSIVNLNVSYYLPVKWYTAFASLNTYYSRYIADFGPGRTIDLDVIVFNIYMQHSFKLGKAWSAEVSGWYVSPSIWQGFSKSSRMWSMDAGFQKTIFKGAGNVKAAVSDIFQSMRWKGVSDFAGQHSVATGGWESRLFKLNFSWRFGNTQVKEAHQRKTGTEDESKRIREENNGMNQR
jgi:iron complex outermembrane recepter protein